jgi:hypothetical protein
MTGIGKEHVIKGEGKKGRKGCKERKKEYKGWVGDELFPIC